ncbi:MAG: hypothetical protein ACYTGQ_09270 [Planctomycetota bacterium]|jgi:hypothetical protein
MSSSMSLNEVRKLSRSERVSGATPHTPPSYPPSHPPHNLSTTYTHLATPTE